MTVRHVTEATSADRVCPPCGSGLVYAVTGVAARIKLTGAGGVLAFAAGSMVRFHYRAGSTPAACFLRFGGAAVDVSVASVTPAADTADLILENGVPEELGLPDDPTAPADDLYLAFEGTSNGILALAAVSP